MSDLIGAPEDSNDIIALAKYWATRQLPYIPQRPYDTDYPRNSAVRVGAYSDIVKGLSSYLPPENAIALLNFVTHEAQLALPEYSPDDEHPYLGWRLVIEALTNLVAGYLQIEAYAAALETAHLINDEVQQVKEIANVAVVLFQKRRFQEAQDAYASAEHAANAITNVYIQYEARAVLLESALQIKGPEAAARLSENLKGQDSITLRYINSLIRRLISQNQLTNAQKVADCLTNKVNRATALSEIAVALANTGMQNLSKALISKLEEQLAASGDPQERLSLLCSLGIAFYKMSDVTQADSLLSQAAELVQLMAPGGISTPLVQYPMALATCGYYERARQTAQAISSSFGPENALPDLTIFLQNISEFDEAHKTATLIDDKYWQARALILLVKVLLNDGQVERADKLLDEVIVLINGFDFVVIQPLDRYLVTQMLVRFHRIPEAFGYLDKAGIDELIKALSNASAYFERLEKGLAVHVIQSVIEIAAQKHPDYQPLLTLIG